MWLHLCLMAWNGQFQKSQELRKWKAQVEFTAFFAGIQDKLAIFPDYGFKSSDTIAGTSFSGIVGGVVVILLCVVCCNLFKFFRKKA